MLELEEWDFPEFKAQVIDDNTPLAPPWPITYGPKKTLWQKVSYRIWQLTHPFRRE